MNENHAILAFDFALFAVDDSHVSTSEIFAQKW